VIDFSKIGDRLEPETLVKTDRCVIRRVDAADHDMLRCRPFAEAGGLLNRGRSARAAQANRSCG
jgi:hypothetical protein